jgi:hypothetical protein
MRAIGTTALALVLLLGASHAQAGVVEDSWSDPYDLLDAAGGGNGGPYLAPVHASLMPDGSVVLFAWRQAGATVANPQARLHASTALLAPTQLQPAPGTTSLALQTFAEPVLYNRVVPGPSPSFLVDTLFCSGHALQPDGRLLVVGGLRKMSFGADEASYQISGGLPHLSTWDPARRAWMTSSPVMTGTGSAGFAVPKFFEGPERFYPTVTRLPGGRMLIVSGSQILEGSVTIEGTTTRYSGRKNLSVETYDPATGSFSLLSHDPAMLLAPDTPPEVFNKDYTHVFSLPAPVRHGAGTFDVAMIGQSGEPVLMSTAGLPRWSSLAPPRPAGIPNPCVGASTLMLPLRAPGDGFGYPAGALLVTGGGDTLRPQDRFDVYAPTRHAWIRSGHLSVVRHHPSTVLLPDGKVLVVAGHAGPGRPPFGLRRAEYLDPRNGFSVELGASINSTVRGYHGRLNGANPQASGIPERATLEILEPPYCAEPRPRILSAPGTIRYGRAFALAADVPVHEVVLLALGSMTHSVDMNQRYVQLELLRGGLAGTHSRPTSPRVLPPDARRAPPGHYMLFVLDRELVPSVARIVRLR